MGSLSIWHWLIVLLVVVLVFGTKKLRNIGGDVGGAVKNFKDAMAAEQGNSEHRDAPGLIEAEVKEVPVAKAPPKKRAVAAKPATKKVAASKATAKPRATKAKAE